MQPLEIYAPLRAAISVTRAPAVTLTGCMFFRYLPLIFALATAGDIGAAPCSSIRYSRSCGNPNEMHVFSISPSDFLTRTGGRPPDFQLLGMAEPRRAPSCADKYAPGLPYCTYRASVMYVPRGLCESPLATRLTTFPSPLGPIHDHTMCTDAHLPLSLCGTGAVLLIWRGRGRGGCRLFGVNCADAGGW